MQWSLMSVTSYTSSIHSNILILTLKLSPKPTNMRYLIYFYIWTLFPGVISCSNFCMASAATQILSSSLLWIPKNKERVLCLISGISAPIFKTFLPPKCRCFLAASALSTLTCFFQPVSCIRNPFWNQHIRCSYLQFFNLSSASLLE